MTSFVFLGTIDSIGVKKGNIKLQISATTISSLDRLAKIALPEDSIKITLESMQTKLDVGDPITLKGEAAEKLKDAAERSKNGDDHR